MRKHILLIFIIMLAAALSGCIVTKTPSSSNVTMSYGDTKTFKVASLTLSISQATHSALSL